MDISPSPSDLNALSDSIQPLDNPTAQAIPTPVNGQITDAVPNPYTQLETAGPSRQALIIALVAIFFFAAGMVVGGLLLGGKSIEPQELSALVRSVVADEVSKIAGSDAAKTSLISNDSDDPSFGSDDALITIVEFSDFYCGFCGRFAKETLPQLRETYGDKIRFVYRDMPIIGGTVSVEAAVAANCANQQGKFWEFHNLLFANQSATDATARLAFAGELGMDTVAYETCINNQDNVDEVTLDLLDGQSLGISGTPAFYINGRFISGAHPYETFQLLIDTELAKMGVE